MAFSALCVSCTVPAGPSESEVAQVLLQGVTYVKDKKTGMCFALLGTRKLGKAVGQSVSLTWVPCEPVEKYITE